MNYHPSPYAPNYENVIHEGAQTTGDVGTDPFTRWLIYGDLGEGKTYTIGLIHEKLKSLGTKGVYLLDSDGGRNTLAAAGFDVTFKHLTEWRIFEQTMTAFMNGSHGFGALAIDSLTTLQKVAMGYVHQINQTKRQLGWMSSQNDYGVLIQLLEQTFPQMLEVSQHMHLILTAHVLERQNEVSQAVENLPAVIGKKMPSAIGLWFNEVWRIFAVRMGDKVDRMVQTASGDRFKCKTQTRDMKYRETIQEALNKVALQWPMIDTAKAITAGAEG